MQSMVAGNVRIASNLSTPKDFFGEFNGGRLRDSQLIHPKFGIDLFENMVCDMPLRDHRN